MDVLDWCIRRSSVSFVSFPFLELLTMPQFDGLIYKRSISCCHIRKKIGTVEISSWPPNQKLLHRNCCPCYFDQFWVNCQFFVYALMSIFIAAFYAETSKVDFCYGYFQHLRMFQRTYVCINMECTLICTNNTVHQRNRNRCIRIASHIQNYASTDFLAKKILRVPWPVIHMENKK